jgi:hypothetical protein
MKWSPPRWLGGRDDPEQAAKQDDALVDTPAHSDAVEDDDVLADEASARPTGRFRRLQRRRSAEK